MNTIKKILIILLTVIILGALAFFALDLVKPKSETIEKPASLPATDDMATTAPGATPPAPSEQ